MNIPTSINNTMTLRLYVGICISVCGIILGIAFATVGMNMFTIMLPLLISVATWGFLMGLTTTMAKWENYNE